MEPSFAKASEDKAGSRGQGAGSREVDRVDRVDKVYIVETSGMASKRNLAGTLL